MCEDCEPEYDGHSESSDKREWIYMRDPDLDPELSIDLLAVRSMAAVGQYDVALGKIAMTQAYLELLKGKTLNSKAATLSQMGKREAINKAHKAAWTCKQRLSTLCCEELDKIMYAEALLLCANTEARLVRDMKGFNIGDKVRNARQDAEEAVEILSALDHPAHPTLANAYRVQGVIELVQGHYNEAMKFFKDALRTFAESSKGLEDKWCSVAFLNMHVALLALGNGQAALPWLKQATIKHKVTEGPDHFYTKDCGKRLRDNYKIDYEKEEDLSLSHQENAAIQLELGLDLEDTSFW